MFAYLFNIRLCCSDRSMFSITQISSSREFSDCMGIVLFYLSIYFKISVNGFLTFEQPYIGYTPVAFPNDGDGTYFASIFVFFADVNPVCGTSRITGDLFFRTSKG